MVLFICFMRRGTRKNAVNILLKLLSHRYCHYGRGGNYPGGTDPLWVDEFIPMQVIPIAGMIAGNAMERWGCVTTI